MNFFSVSKLKIIYKRMFALSLIIFLVAITSVSYPETSFEKNIICYFELIISFFFMLISLFLKLIRIVKKNKVND